MPDGCRAIFRALGTAHGDHGSQPARSCIQPRRGRRRLTGRRPTDASHLEAVLMETPCLRATVVGESVGFSPLGTGHFGRAAGCNGMDSRLRADHAATRDTPINRPTWAQPFAQSSGLTVSHAMCLSPVCLMVVLQSNTPDTLDGCCAICQAGRPWKRGTRQMPSFVSMNR
ncbi:MAG: hypothetical protein JWM59_5086 [Verrucomicrobiales bacterium]|nr:hypothetical protein [Verrucomicrobiales bacterium]